jgi:hypothetical protein
MGIIVNSFTFTVAKPLPSGISVLAHDLLPKVIPKNNCIVAPVQTQTMDAVK